MSLRLQQLNPVHHYMRRLFLAIVVSFGSVSALGQDLNGLETWKIIEGTLTLNIQHHILNEHGIQLYTDTASNSLTHSPTITLQIAPDSTIVVDTRDRRFVMVDGSIRFHESLNLQTPWLHRSLQKLTISTLSADDETKFSLIGEPGRNSQGLIFSVANIRLDPMGKVLLVDTDFVQFSPALTKLMGKRNLSDQSIGGMVLQLSFERYKDGQQIATPKSSTPLPIEGTTAVTIGPDIIVASLPNTGRQGSNYSVLCGDCYEFPLPSVESDCTSSLIVPCITVFSVGTTSCNVGDTRAQWYASTPAHPVIAQNMYRYEPHRFEQIGMSWLKHGFFAISGNLCGECMDVPGKECVDTREPCDSNADCAPDIECFDFRGKELGVGCSDPYNAGLNGMQSNLGPRSDVNPFTGVFPWPFRFFESPFTGTVIERRIQVLHDDLDPVTHSGAQYFVEGHYVSADDAQAGNGTNNVSFRPIFVDLQDVEFYRIAVFGTTRTELPAIRAWREIDDSVVETIVEVPNEGRFVLSAKAWLLNNGLWRYEYALQNINSDRACGSFSIPLPLGAALERIGFHDVDYHSDEIFDTTDWFPTVLDDQIIWATTPHIFDVNANALRWGTLYNFRFDTNIAPEPTTITIGLFKPGTPLAVDVASIGPSAGFVDCNNNDVTDVCDIDCSVPGCEQPCGTVPDCNNNRIPDDCESDCNGNMVADACDISGETSMDCNLNLLPDECDILAGTSDDCDENNVPDDCEILTDSDGDGIADCFDLCPFDTAPDGFCRCPDRDRCCLPSGICLDPGGLTRDECLAVGGTPDCILSTCREGCLLGDIDGDGDIDLHDLMSFQSCYSGSFDLPEYVLPAEDCLLRFDYDLDSDVDGLDLQEFIRDLKGPLTE